MPPDLRNQAALASLGGVLSTALDAAVLMVLVETGCSVGPAALMAACAGAVLGFCFNRRVVFADRSPVRWQQAASAAAVALVGAFALAIAMFVTSDLLGVPYLLAKAVCAVVVFAIWSFPAQRYLVFPAAFGRSPASGSF